MQAASVAGSVEMLDFWADSVHLRACENTSEDCDSDTG